LQQPASVAGTPQTRSHIGKFFSQRRRTRWLTVGSREHCGIRVQLRKLRELVDACLKFSDSVTRAAFNIRA